MGYSVCIPKNKVTKKSFSTKKKEKITDSDPLNVL